jgi:hypothetical protein
MTTTVTGSQLIYTNVEADRSPTRQRGFQVWLASRDLSADAKRAAAKVLGDFRLPPGVSADDPAVVRHVFARLPDGPFLIARTVPLTDRDKFGRGGKFHAHAVLLPDESFRQLGYDPFRVIDGGFTFHNHPDDAGDLWRTGDLGPAEIRPCEPSADVADLPPKLVAELLAHVERGDDKPVVVAEKPARVLAVLRGLFRAFPPAARARLFFDTLSTGAASEARPAVVGAWSPDLLRLWPSRKYHRLDPATGDCTPKLVPAPGLPWSLLSTPGWANLTDPEREAVLATAGALVAGGRTGLPPDLPAAGITLLEQTVEFRQAVADAVTSWSAANLPPAMAVIPEVAAAVSGYYTGPAAEVLDRLRRRPPRLQIARALYKVLDRDRWPPPAALVSDLGRWLAGGGPVIPRLELIYSRWRGEPADLDRLAGFLNTADPPGRAEWFRGWLADTLEGQTVDDLLRRLPIGPMADTDALRDARAWLALQPDRSTPAWVQLRLHVAFHTGMNDLRAAVVGPNRLPKADQWLTKTLSEMVYRLCQPAWATDVRGRWRVGFFVVLDPVGAVLADALSGSEDDVKGRFVERLCKAVTRVQVRDARSETSDEILSTFIESYYENVLKATSANAREEAVRHLRHQLVIGPNNDFRGVANKALQQFVPACLVGLTGEYHLAGYELTARQGDNPDGWAGILKAVLSAVVPEFKPTRAGDPGGQLPPQEARRLTWLLNRLRDPVGTVNRDI